MIESILVLLLAIPTGFLIAWLARDELVDGKKWFWALIVASSFVVVWGFLGEEKTVTWTALFVILSTAISIFKSRDKKWTRKKDS